MIIYIGLQDTVVKSANKTLLIYILIRTIHVGADDRQPTIESFYG